MYKEQLKWEQSTIKRSEKDTEMLQKPISIEMGGIRETAFQSDRKS